MDAKVVAQRISAARKAVGLTQEGLAAKANISATHVGVIERGKKVPNLDTFVAIANALEVSADELLQDVVNKSNSYTSSELSKLLNDQSPEMQRKIYRAVRALIEQ